MNIIYIPSMGIWLNLLLPQTLGGKQTMVTGKIENKEENKGDSRWSVLIILCCVVPILVVAYLLIGSSTFPSGGALLFLLICPLMHLIMMRRMHKH